MCYPVARKLGLILYFTSLPSRMVVPVLLVAPFEEKGQSGELMLSLHGKLEEIPMSDAW